MPLETTIKEGESVMSSKERIYVVDVPIINRDTNGNCKINYRPMEFSTLEFYGESYKIKKLGEEK